MERKFERLFILFIMILCIVMVPFSCTTNSDRTEKVFEQVEALVNLNPDSALRLLEGIEYPEILDEPLYYKHVLLTVQAKNKGRKDISKDTLIREAADFFIRIGDEEHAASARFYSGRIFLAAEDYKKAINEYLAAEELAQKLKDDYLLALINYDIGVIYRRQLNYEKCLKHYYVSKEYFSRINNKKQENNVLNQIGNVYLRMDPPQLEKAFSIYNQALEYAMQEKDTMQVYVCLNNMSVAYRDMGDYANAKKYINESISLDKENKILFKNYSILVSIYIATNELDSALFYLNSISDFMENNQNKFELNNYYKLLYTVYEEKKDYQTALAYYKKSHEYQNRIYDENNKNSILEIQNKYDKTKDDNRNHQLLIKQQRTQLLLVVISFLTLFVILISVALYRKNRKKKRDAETRIETLNNLLSDSHKSNERLRNRVIEELELTKKIAYIHATDSNKAKKVITEYDKLFDKNLQNALDWRNLYKLIDELYPGFRKTFDGQYPDLSEKERQMCYLTKAGFKTNEVAYLLGYSRESADTMKCKIRRKSGFNSMAEFTEFLNNL